MIYSMTGYGESEYSSPEAHIKIDIRSLNHKKLEIFSNLPFFLQFMETDLRKIISEHVKRGKINYCVKVFHWEKESEVYIDRQKIKALISKIKDIQDDLSISIDMDLKTLLSLPEVMMTREDDIDKDKALGLIGPVLVKSLKSLKESRAREGEYLFKDIMSSIKTIKFTLDEIISLKQEAIELFKENYESKITKLIEEYHDDLDKNRLYQEMAFLLDKSDIQEEIIRLESHINQLEKSFLQNNAPIGKSVNFLLQEMNREANTLGVKCSHLPIIRKNLIMKEEIEKIREQIQNVE